MKNKSFDIKTYIAQINTNSMHEKRRKVCFVAVICLTLFLLGAKVSKEKNDQISRNTAHSKTVTQLETKLDNIHFTIKTSKAFLRTKMTILAKTWIKSVKKQAYIFTDDDDKEAPNLGGQIVATNCGHTHGRNDLCCKTEKEFESYISSDKNWWCHFDDDIYVNLKALLATLNKYNPNEEDIYIGHEIRTWGVVKTYKNVEQRGHFLTGNGYCISRVLSKKMKLWIGKGKFIRTCNDVKSPDDVAIGYMITSVLKINLIECPLFHSHDENLRKSMLHIDLAKQISFPYKNQNVLHFNNSVQPAFTVQDDPTRFLSLHCILNPSDEICPDLT